MLVSFDLETTNTDPETGLILECALQKFHPETLTVESENSTLVLHPTLPTLSPTVREMHTENGLLHDLQTATLRADGWVGGHRALDIWVADQLTYMRAEPASVLLVGMSIQFDRRWVERHLPFTKAFLSHRMLDLSTVREILRLWEPLGCIQLPKVEKIPHRSLDDCKMALKTLRWYQENVFLNRPAARLLALEELRGHHKLKELQHALHCLRRGETARLLDPGGILDPILMFLDTL